jgi:hypothetical protein
VETGSPVGAASSASPGVGSRFAVALVLGLVVGFVVGAIAGPVVKAAERLSQRK